MRYSINSIEIGIIYSLSTRAGMVLTRTAFKASGQFHQFALGQAKALVATVTSGPDSMPVGAQGSSSLSPKIQDSKQRLKRTRVLIEPVSALHKDTHSVELSEKGVGKRRKVTAKQIQKEVKEEIEEAVLGDAEETELTPKVKRKQKAKAKLANGSTDVVKGPRKQAKKAKKLLESLHTEETLPEIRAKANKVSLAVTCDLQHLTQPAETLRPPIGPLTFTRT